MNPGAKIRISFMGYRDYTEPNEKRIYYSKEFTENVSDFNLFLSNLDCIEICESTKIMFNVIKDFYNDNNKFHVEKFGYDVSKFSFFVAFSALLGNAKI